MLGGPGTDTVDGGQGGDECSDDPSTDPSYAIYLIGFVATHPC
jgi:hypothetical protein